MSSYTPGPWLTFVTITGKRYVASEDVGAVRVYDGNVAKIPDRRGEGKANAHLIAAAPDLLRLLIEGREGWPVGCECNISDITGCWRCETDRAIAKATGGSK